MTLTATLAPTNVVTERLFSLHDRCDRCGFQSYYVAQKNGSEILFCAHHGNEHSVALDFQGWSMLDFTSNLDPTPVDNT